MSNEGFKFACPYCSQHIRAYDEHIGDVVTCPTCQAEIVVPNPYSNRQPEYVVDEPSSPFYTQAELMAIRDEPDDLKAQILEVEKENSWEMAILAVVMRYKVLPLQDTLKEFTKPRSFHDEPVPRHETLFADIDDRFNRFITVMYATYDILLYGLPRAATQESLVLIMDFGNKLGEQVDGLCTYHKSLFDYALPMQEPYPTIQEAQIHWAEHVLHTLTDIANFLSSEGQLAREEANLELLQTSLSPPNLRHFLVLRQMLVQQIRQDRQGTQPATEPPTDVEAEPTTEVD